MTIYIIGLIVGFLNLIGGLSMNNRVSSCMATLLIGFCLACITIKEGWITL